MERAERYRAARRDPDLVVLEGFHALKHALRFGAVLLDAVVVDRPEVLELCQQLAPELASRLAGEATEIDAGDFEALAPQSHPTGVMALAQRPRIDIESLLRGAGGAPLVLIEEPVHLGNLGASVRVAAAAGAAGLVNTGVHDPWSPEAVRAAAGLQFALPVAQIETLGNTDRLVVAVTPEGEPIDACPVPDGSLLAFGSERRGLGPELRRRADLRIALPMRPGISSLNVATSVAATLYAWRLGLASAR